MHALLSMAPDLELQNQTAVPKLIQHMLSDCTLEHSLSQTSISATTAVQLYMWHACDPLVSDRVDTLHSAMHAAAISTDLQLFTFIKYIH